MHQINLCFFCKEYVISLRRQERPAIFYPSSFVKLNQSSEALSPCREDGKIFVKRQIFLKEYVS